MRGRRRLVRDAMNGWRVGAGVIRVAGSNRRACLQHDQRLSLSVDPRCGFSCAFVPDLLHLEKKLFVDHLAWSLISAHYVVAVLERMA